MSTAVDTNLNITDADVLGNKDADDASTESKVSVDMKETETSASIHEIEIEETKEHENSIEPEFSADIQEAEASTDMKEITNERKHFKKLSEAKRHVFNFFLDPLTPANSSGTAEPPSPAASTVTDNGSESPTSLTSVTHGKLMKNEGYEGVSYENNQDAFWRDRALSGGILEDWKVCCCYGLASVMSGQFVGFNPGYSSGVFGFFISFILVTIAYMCLAFCMGELASSMPFCGGSYGYARQSMGKNAGLLVGSIECIEYIFLLTTNLYYLGQLFSLITGLDPKLEPIWWLIIYLINLYVQVNGGRLMFKIAAFLALFNIGILVVFVLGTLKWADLGHFGQLPVHAEAISASSTENHWAYGGTSDGGWITKNAGTFFAAFPFAMWPFIGVEIIPMTSEEVKEPRKNIPKAIISATTILALCTLPILLLVPSLPSITAAVHGDLAVENNLLDISTQGFPLNGGFSLLFTGGDAARLTLAQANMLVIISMFPVWNNGYGTGIGAARQMFAMSRSGYFPKVLSLTSKKGSPYVSHMVITIICYVTSLIVKFSPDPVKAFNLIFNITSICGLVNYLIQLVNFCVYRFQFRKDEKSYRSPLGIYGAVLGFIIFFVAFISMCVYTVNMGDAFYTLFALISVPICYYIFYSRKHLTISPEELHAFLRVMSQKQNILARKNLKKLSVRRQTTTDASSKVRLSATTKSSTVELQETPH